jgi:hypothetical protein
VAALCTSDYAQIEHFHGSIGHLDISNFPGGFAAFFTECRFESVANNRLNLFFTEGRGHAGTILCLMCIEKVMRVADQYLSA